MNKQNEINDYEVPRYVFIILIIISILGYIFGGLFYFFPYGRYIFFAIFIFSILMLFKSKKKVYKSNSVPKEMKIQYIFYTIGVLFIFASFYWFAKEFINDLPDPIKLTILIAAVFITFVIAELLRGGDR